MLLNKFYSHYNVSVFISWTLSGRVMRFLKSLEHILVGRYLWQIWFSCYIWSTGQQEPDKEAGASVDEVARQLERQALEEKERDDDDEDGDGDGDGATGKKKKKKKKKRGR